MKVSLKVLTAGGYTKAYADDAKRVKQTERAVMKQAGDIIKREGRAAIQAGGFSGSFANAFSVRSYSDAVSAIHRIPWAGQFEDPIPVIGHPYVWIPINENLPGGGRTRWTPQKFTNQIGPLRAGRHGGKPMLFGQVSIRGATTLGPVKAKTFKVLPLTRKGVRARPAKKQWLPVFVGIRQVNDPKRFDTGEIVNEVGGKLPELYSKIWDGNGG